MTVDLDTRLRAAGDALVRATAQPSPAAPPRSLRPLATVVAGVVAVVALGAGTIAVRGDAGDGATDPATTVSVPRLVPDVVPEGLRPAGVAELPLGALAPAPTESISVYGDPAADDPFATADLAIYTSRVPTAPDQLDLLGDTDPVTVRGREGFADGYLPEGVLLVWQEAPGLAIGLGSRALSLDQLLAIAEGLAVDGEARTVEVGPLPEGIEGDLAPVGSVDDFASSPALAPLAVAVPASGDGHLATYQPDPPGSVGAAFVAVFLVDADDAAVVRWMTGAGTATDVRGHPGWSGSLELPAAPDGGDGDPGSEGLSVSTLVWEEGPGVLGLVQMFGRGEGDARAMAASLRPAAEDEWARLLELGESGLGFGTE